MIAHEYKATIRGYERQYLLVFPPFQPDTGVEGYIIQNSGIDKGHVEIRHSGQVDITVYLKKYTQNIIQCKAKIY